MTRSMAPLAAPAPAADRTWTAPRFEPYTLVVVDQVQTTGRPWAAVTSTDDCTHPFHDGCRLMHRRADDGWVLPPIHCQVGCHLWVRRLVDRQVAR